MISVNIRDICFDKATRALLEANGRDDCNRGISMYDGWQEVAQGCGFDPHSRTPAREAYEDGYYSGTPPNKTGDKR